MLVVPVWISKVVSHSVVTSVAETWHNKSLDWSNLAMCESMFLSAHCKVESRPALQPLSRSLDPRVFIYPLQPSIVENLNTKLKVLYLWKSVIFLVPVWLWLEAAGAGAGREQELVCKPPCQTCRAQEEVRSCHPQLWGVKVDSLKRFCLNCSRFWGEMIKFGSSFGPARRRFGIAFLPAPVLLLHNMGYLSPLKLFCVWILLCLWHQRNGALAPFEISAWNTKAAYLITLDLASARQFSPSAVATCSEIILSD